MSDEQELRMHAVVTELLAYLRIAEEPERVLEKLRLQRHGYTPVKPSSLSQQAAFPLAEQISLKAYQLAQDSPERFQHILHKLQSQHLRDLDPLLYVLNKVLSDPAVAASLAASRSSANAASAGAAGSTSATSASASAASASAAASAGPSGVPSRLRPTVSTGSLKDLAHQGPRSPAIHLAMQTPKTAYEKLLGQRPLDAAAEALSRRMAKSRSSTNLAAASAASAGLGAYASANASESVGDGTTLAMTPSRSTVLGDRLDMPRTARKGDQQQHQHQQQPRPPKLKAPLAPHHNPPTKQDQNVPRSPASNLLFDMSSYDQEALIIEDLLYVLMGIDGEFICRVEPSGDGLEVPSFSLDGHLDPSLNEMVTKILPLAGHYSLLETFIETHIDFEYGRVFHALCAAIRTLLQEYLVLIGQLEHLAHTSPKFTLQKMWYYLAPSLETMGCLAAVVAAVHDASKVVRMPTDLYDIRHVIDVSSTNRNGGMLLSIIAERMISLGGNANAKRLISFLLSRAAVPYLSILNTWIFCGALDDEHNEFMITERKYLNKDMIPSDFNDAYWEQRYALRDDGVPMLLEPWKDKVLLAGKYLNVLRECGIEVPKPDEMDSGLGGAAGSGSGGVDSTQQALAHGAQITGLTDVARAIDGGRFASDIERAYLFANKALIDLLVKDHKLFDRLRSLKRFFLLEQSDYLTHFMDLAVADLARPASQVPIEKVRSLLELVIRSPSSCCSGDPYKDDISIEMSSLSLFQQLLKINAVVGLDMHKHMLNMRSGRAFDIDASLATAGHVPTLGGLAGDTAPLTGIEAFVLTYTVTFPLSLVINKKVLTKYQMIFRQLFLCKYLERLLSGTWLGQTKLRNRLDNQLKNVLVETSPDGAEFLPSDTAMLGRMSLLREKMLHFIKIFMYYVFFEVLEPNWCSLETKLRKVATVDQILEAHDDFLDSCLKECMLTHPRLIKIFSSLLTTCHECVHFSDSYARFKASLQMPQSSRTFASGPRNSRPGTGTSTPTSVDAHPVESSTTAFFANTTYEHSSLSDESKIKSLEDAFMRHISKLMDLLQALGVTETPRLSHLLSQLDFNSYYERLPSTTLPFTSSPAVPIIKRPGSTGAPSGVGSSFS